MSFNAGNELNAHIASSHQIRRPFLLIGGIEPGGDDVVRLRLSTQSIELFHCTELSAGFDGEPIHAISPASFKNALRKAKRTTVQVRLSNHGDGNTEPLISAYRLKVFAPDEASVAAIDEQFLATIGQKDVNLEKVANFYEETRNSAAAEYAEALADYVRAVLIKDGDIQTGVSTKLNHYRDVQNRSLYTLQGFHNPLARLLCSILRFNQNDFTSSQEFSGFPQMDRANVLLGQLARHQVRQENWKQANPPLSNKKPVFICPVDIGTDTVVRSATQASELARWGTTVEKQFSAMADQASMDPLDRAKVIAIWAVTALRLKNPKSANVALRKLDGDSVFGEWVADKLAGAEP